MGQLYYTGLRLAVTTWDDGPAIIQWENVRGVMSRGKEILEESKALLREHDYEVDERVFDCAEVGGTPARRPRHILIARRRDLCRQMVALPPKQAPKGAVNKRQTAEEKSAKVMAHTAAVVANHPTTRRRGPQDVKK